MTSLLFVTFVAAAVASPGAPPAARAESRASSVRAAEVDEVSPAASHGEGEQTRSASPPAQQAAPVPPPDYAYDAVSRRDPFVSLVNRGSDTPQGTVKGARAEGIAGVLVDEVAVRGIVGSRGAWVAMIAAPDGRTYTIRPGDRLMDGAVRAITAQTVVLMQEVNDPSSLEKQREVRKPLRAEVK
jgi:Tfp pilus assembly protein PilP